MADGGALLPARPAPTARAYGFANGPDRGDLLQYPATPVVRRTSAYTWHSVGLSEEHAVRAVVAGRMRVTAPDGSPIALDYVRHVEHVDGNWTWIGRNAEAPGQDAVITFGPEAVFGSIPQGGDLPPLRLTMADGASWVVSTDPHEWGRLRSGGAHPARPDYPAPPRISTSGAAARRVMSTTSAPATVDLLVGYTNGFASARGGSSAALTRIHNLVDMANLRYANSRLDARLRLVHSMQVGYPDATDNRTALEELTGFKAPSTRTIPSPAFSGLRAARDRYGADLVVLLRQFNDPENDGCGIAWLIGDGHTSIEQRDEFFGYSVVGEGQDRGNNGKISVCQDETFAKEVGYNMGVEQDRGTSDANGGLQYGEFDYSFDRKSDSMATNIYTGLALGDTGPAADRVYSTPSNKFYGSRACGVANQSGNRLSSEPVIPTVATFRATVVADEAMLIPKGDVDASGTTDLMWFKPEPDQFSPGHLEIWMMLGYVVERQVAYTTDPSWPEHGMDPYVEGEFNGTPGRDIAWRNDMGNVIYWMGGPTYTRSPYVVQGMSYGWSLQASGDRNGDGISDLYWRSTVDGRLLYWELDPIYHQGYIESYRAFAQSPDSDLLMVGDFNGDGLSELFFRTRATGASEIWFPDGGGYSVAARGAMSKYWRPAGAADYDGDGDDDIVWRSAIDYRVLVWIMQDGLRQDVAIFESDSDRQLLTLAYLNGDRLLDVVWRRADGTVSAWLNTGGGFEHRYIGNRSASWTLFVGGR